MGKGNKMVVTMYLREKDRRRKESGRETLAAEMMTSKVCMGL